MKMIKLFVFFFFLLFAEFHTSFSQVNFERKYSSTPNSTGVIGLLKLQNGKFLLVGQTSEKTIFAIIHPSGSLDYTYSRSSFNDLNFKFHPIAGTYDNLGTYILTQNLSGNGRIEVSKLNSEYSVDWRLLLPTTNSEIACDIIQTNDSNFVILGGIKSGLNFSTLRISKIHHYGILNWTKYFSLPALGSLGYRIQQLVDGSLLIAGKDKVLKSSANGDSLTTFNIGSTIQNFSSDGFSFVVGGTNFISKYDVYGNQLWTKNLEGKTSAVFSMSDGSMIISIIASSGNSITKFDAAGNLIWKESVRGKIYDITLLNNNDLLFGGEYQEMFYLIRTQSNGKYQALDITNIAENQILTSFTDFEINWYAQGVNNLKIEFTSNGGLTWNEIASSVPASSGKYIWNVPAPSTQQHQIRITSNENPQLNFLSPTFKISTMQKYEFIAANEIKMFAANNGEGSHDPTALNGGFYFPNGINGTKSMVFQDGLFWGGIINGEIRSNGNYYQSGLQPGKILSVGVADDPNLDKYKIWKIKKGWEGLPPSNDRSKYEFNYNNWPVDLGAPWVDADGDGIFTAGFDYPHYTGDEVLFYVANDLDTTLSQNVFSANPMGLEFQTTIFAFNENPPIGNCVYKKYRIINKGGTQIDSFYFGYWADIDLGYAADDFIGSDEQLNLAYGYNGNSSDNIYGTPPPAVAHALIAGPIVPASSNDSAIFKGTWRKNFKNLPMTSFSFYKCGDSFYRCPTQAQQTSSVEAYNNLKGLNTLGQAYVNPHSNQQTKFCVNGDPVNSTGWFEGVGWPQGFSPGDRYYLFSSGPFTFAPNDTQEVVIAIFAAQGTSNIQSVQEIKNSFPQIKNFVMNNSLTSIHEETFLPAGYHLNQNYPNPFNPTTVIGYELKESGYVILKIFDILGREVTTLINNEWRRAGKHTVEFNINNGLRTKNGELSTNVLFYQLRAGNSATGSAQVYVETRKMIYLK